MQRHNQKINSDKSIPATAESKNRIPSTGVVTLDSVGAVAM
jgi:hypothetical protein